jgi:hypothetical protein
MFRIYKILKDVPIGCLSVDFLAVFVAPLLCVEQDKRQVQLRIAELQQALDTFPLAQYDIDLLTQLCEDPTKLTERPQSVGDVLSELSDQVFAEVNTYGRLRPETMNLLIVLPVDSIQTVLRDADTLNQSFANIVKQSSTSLNIDTGLSIVPTK